MDMAFRIKSVIELKIPEEKRYKDLAMATQIGADSWRKLFDNKQRPTMQMIEAVCNLWPQYAFWIATGIDDCESGHIAALPTLHDKAQTEITEDSEFFKTYIKLSGNSNKTADTKEAIKNMGKALLIMNYSFRNPKLEKIANKMFKNTQFTNVEYQLVSKERINLIFSDILFARKKDKSTIKKQESSPKMEAID